MLKILLTQLFYIKSSFYYYCLSITLTSTAPVFLKNSTASFSSPCKATSIKKWSSVVLTSGFSACLNGHNLLLKKKVITIKWAAKNTVNSNIIGTNEG